MDKTLQHVGVLGMKWGRRKSRNLTPPTQHLSRKGGKTTIVTRRFGDKKIIRRREVTPEQVKEFMAKQKEKRIKDMNMKSRKASVMILALYGGLLFGPTIIRNVAWATGKVVSNTPLR